MLERIGERLINLDSIASVHWDQATLFIHFVGGRWLKVTGEDANELWRRFAQRASLDALAAAERSSRSG